MTGPNNYRKRYRIQVHEKGLKYLEPGALQEVIYRVLNAKQIGNFNPIFCTYKGASYLVRSLEGDLSDPFRREESYLDSLFIEIDPKPSETVCGHHGCPKPPGHFPGHRGSR